MQFLSSGFFTESSPEYRYSYLFENVQFKLLAGILGTWIMNKHQKCITFRVCIAVFTQHGSIQVV